MTTRIVFGTIEYQKSINPLCNYDAKSLTYSIVEEYNMRKVEYKN